MLILEFPYPELRYPRVHRAIGDKVRVGSQKIQNLANIVCVQFVLNYIDMMSEVAPISLSWVLPTTDIKRI